MCTHFDIYNLPWAYFESAWSRLKQTKVVCTHVDIYNLPWVYFESAWSRLEQTKVVCTHFDIYNLLWAYFESAWSRLEQTKVVCTHFDIYNIYFYQYKQMIMMLCYAMDQRTNTSISQLKDFLEIARFSFFYWAIILLYRYFLIVSIRWNYFYAFCFCFVCCLLFCLFMFFNA